MSVTLKTRIEQLEKFISDLPGRLSSIAENATIRAVEKAADLTPPVGNDLKGTNTRSGEMKQHWATDSTTKPILKGSTYETYLANNKQYASYVNDGHRMDRHFVPGLYVNPFSGLLEYDPTMDVGIMVGTRTQYVPGLFMVDAAQDEYKRVIDYEVKKLLKEAGK